MDRHEYEINQLINPKKDIVKSNSKHRDKIETLIQGRNGISARSDSPSTTPYYAFDYIYGAGPIIHYTGDGVMRVLGDISNSKCFMFFLSNGTKVAGPGSTLQNVIEVFSQKVTNPPMVISDWEIEDSDITTVDMSEVTIMS